ncbi:TIGR04219 family outer membrane beta-barrel protein [uncultured Cocleimonas sp.]|uniref:TIGR04219 family outer membrane beta-barrel protein n=1 Tax=uncultured Cocleimonas sp. TaxID=1051587 RepID=UPI002613BB41|nr:TIGR04219 family outer membrane beta-barrel protein [uncultured Cocleimonas sp.]
MIKTQTTKALSGAIFASLVIGNLILSTAQADTLLGADLEVGVWSPSYDAGSVVGSVSGDDTSIFASATIEHPVPLIPNFKLSLSEVNSDAYEYTKIDYTAYYEILDNDAISIDVGLGISQFEGGKYLSQSFSGAAPHAYFDAEVALPFLNTTLYTDVHYMNYDGNQITDAMAGLRYEFNLVAVDLGLKAGYRVQSFDAKDFDDVSFDVSTDGYFVGLHADF